MAQSHWSDILSAAEIEARHALTESLDPGFAAQEREFYSSRTVAQLESLAAQAWNCCEPGPYQMARSYAALRAQPTASLL